jgi:hypothetical protein
MRGECDLFSLFSAEVENGVAILPLPPFHDVVPSSGTLI